MNVKRSKRYLMLGMAGITVLLLYYGRGTHSNVPQYYPSTSIPEVLETPDEQDTIDQACRHPDLDHMNPLIIKFIKDLGTLKCSTEKNWVHIYQGRVSISPYAIQRHGRIRCKLTFFHRKDEFDNQNISTTILRSEDGSVPLKSDFFHARCKSENKQTWVNLMAGIHRNESIAQRAKSKRTSDRAIKLNVLIFGMDSMSRMHFKRKMSKTYYFLTNTLNAVVLKGYNIIGDGTPQALIPILTGFTEQELPETRKRKANAQYVDVYPFAWNNFTSSGYVTAWGEEQPGIGTFTYRLKGFKKQPTDHYMRSFYLELGKVLSEHRKYCLGEDPRHKIMMQWIERFFEVYGDVPKFGFGFLSELSHDDYNTIGYADNDMEEFFKRLHISGKLNDTLLIVMSDHGHRFAPIRASQQGKLEERMPFFSVIVPPWLEKVYPMHVKNLRINSDRLVTPFDIYATLMTLLDSAVPIHGEVNQRSISLFTEIPKERSCASASIEPHWCACLTWKEVSTDDAFSQDIGKEVVRLINGLTVEIRSQCEELHLEKITRLEKMIPNKALLKFKENADKDGFVGRFTDNTQVSEAYYQIQILTTPSHGLYEALVKHDVKSNSFNLKEDDLSRVNTYDMQDHCINKTHPGLGKYCYCKIQLTSILKH